MSHTNFKTRILFTGAVLLTLGAGFFAAMIISGLVDQVCHWPGGAPQGTLETLRQGLQIPWNFLMLFAVAALPAGVWMRILRRRAVINSLSEGTAYFFTPRSKYAVWSHARRSAGTRAALPTRKRLRS